MILLRLIVTRGVIKAWRLFDDIDISPIRIRRFDGANTWEFLD